MPSDAVLSTPALLVRLRPATPWRLGPDCGSRDRVDPVCHSDTLFAAVCSALNRLGMLDEWLAATAGASGPSQVRFSSAFPFLGDTLFVTPPRHLWPPVPSSKVRWKGARFVPLTAVGKLLEGAALPEENWVVDGASGCLLPLPSRGALRGPFRIATRAAAAVDRHTGTPEPHSTACLEFCGGAGLWFLAEFASPEAFERWNQPVRAALRLLADSGIGGERSRGWGRAAAPEFEAGSLPEMIFTLPPAPSGVDQDGEPLPRPETAWWLLSLFNPGQSDRVDWKRGCYSVSERSGRIESSHRWGEIKRPLRLIAEGSVLMAEQAPSGAARDVAPEGFPHPVYRAGFAVAIPIPYRGAA